jgi:hypothetical protein
MLNGRLGKGKSLLITVEKMQFARSFNAVESMLPKQTIRSFAKEVFVPETLK